jgi:hypothetical protein
MERWGCSCLSAQRDKDKDKVAISHHNQASIHMEALKPANISNSGSREKG